MGVKVFGEAVSRSNLLLPANDAELAVNQPPVKNFPVAVILLSIGENFNYFRRAILPFDGCVPVTVPKMRLCNVRTFPLQNVHFV